MQNTPEVPDLLGVAAAAADWWVGMLTGWPTVPESYVATHADEATAALVEDPNGRMLAWSLLGAGIVTVAEVAAVGERLRVGVGGLLTVGRLPVRLRHQRRSTPLPLDRPSPVFAALPAGAPMEIDPLEGLPVADLAVRPFVSDTMGDWVMDLDVNGSVRLMLAGAETDQMDVDAGNLDTAARRLWDRRLWRAAIGVADVVTRTVRAMPDWWVGVDDRAHQDVTAVVAVWISATADLCGARTPADVERLDLDLVHSIREMSIGDVLAATEAPEEDLGGAHVERLAAHGVPVGVEERAAQTLDILIVALLDKGIRHPQVGDLLRLLRPRTAVGPYLAAGD